MLFTPDHIDVQKVVNAVNTLDQVKKLHHVHIWNLSDNDLDLEADVTTTQFNSILEKIEQLLHEQFNINHITIQPEFNKKDPKDVIVQD